MTTQLSPAIDHFLAAVEAAAIEGCNVWSADAVVDATVPNWRFHITGQDAIRAEYAKWFADPGAFEQLCRLPTEDGEVVEYTLAWTEDGVTHAAHHIHLLTVERGLIVADTVVCGGPLACTAAGRDGRQCLAQRRRPRRSRSPSTNCWPAAPTVN